MKTLKQILEEAQLSLSDQWLWKHLVKEWLQQKQNTLIKNGTFYCYSKIQELLEEVEKNE